MRRLFVYSSLLLLATMGWAANRPDSSSVNAYFFCINEPITPLPPTPLLGAAPTIQPLCYRLFRFGAHPSQIATSRGVYTWTSFDSLVNGVYASGIRMFYNFQELPSFITGSSDPDCGSRLGSCYPPTDNNSACVAQGSLAGKSFPNNCMVRELVNDILLHATANGTPIWGIELGNEANFCDTNNSAPCDVTAHLTTSVNWIGTAAQHAQMSAAIAAQARITQPGIQILSPSVSLITSANCTGAGVVGQEWLKKWMAAGGSSFVDYAAIHLYPSSTPIAESASSAAEQADGQITALKNCGMNMPLFDTESSWGNGVFNGDAITAISRTSNTVTVTSQFAGTGVTAGDVGSNVTIVGVTAGATSWDGAYTIVSVPDNQHFTYAQTAANDSSTGGGWVLTSQLQLQADYIARHLLLIFSRGVTASSWYGWGEINWGTLTRSWSGGSILDTTLARTAYGEIYKWLADATANGVCSQNGTVWTCNYTKGDGYKSQAVWDTSGSSTYTFPANYQQYRALTGGTTSLSGTTVSIGATPILLESIPRNGGGK